MRFFRHKFNSCFCSNREFSNLGGSCLDSLCISLSDIEYKFKKILGKPLKGANLFTSVKNGSQGPPSPTAQKMFLRALGKRSADSLHGPLCFQLSLLLG